MSESQKPTSFSTSRPVAVTMVFLAAVVFGFFSYGRLPITLMPELSYPTITVRTEYPGAAPEEVENDISRPIEESLGVIGGLSRISSISRAGVSDVVLEFTWDTDMSEAIQDTLEKLDLVFLPDESERPLILRFDPSLDPVLELSLSGRGNRFEGLGEDGLRAVRRIAELQVRRALEPIKGVAAVRIRGGLEEEIHVLVDDEKLRRTGLSIQRVIDRLRQENVNVAGGTIKEGRTEYMVRTLNEYQNLEQISDTVVARVEGRDVRIRDVAEVEMSHKEREILTRTDGGESVQIDVYKEADANMVALSAAVREALGEFDPDEWEKKEAEKAAGKVEKPPPTFAGGPGGGPGGPGGFGPKPPGLAETLYKNESVLLEVVADRSIFIKSSIDEVRDTAIFGGLLAVVVLFLFLRNLKSTAIIAVSIPISLLVTFAPLNVLGVTLNIMSLGGLALGIGMLVDSSIVVLESIYRCREEGDDVAAAAVRGAGEVRGAVIASTLTSIAVFFPMVFVEGVAGQAFGDLGLAVVISLIASLIVAVSFIPMLASRSGLDLSGKAEQGKGWLRFQSLHLLKSDVKSSAAWAKDGGVWRWFPALLFMLYAAIRFPLHLVFEILGKIVLFIFYVVSRIGAVLFVPTRALFRGLAWGPLKLVGWTLDRLQAIYPKVLGTALRSPLTVVVLALAFIAVTGWLGTQIDSELLPEVHQGEFTVEVALPVGTPLEATDEILKPIEDVILSELEELSIETLLVTIGYDAANSQRSDEGEHTARFKVLLERAEKGLEEDVIRRLRARFDQVPDLDARIVRPVLFSFRTPIEVEVHGDDLVQLRNYAEQVRDQMAEMPELADVETTQRAGAPEMQIVYDRDLLARYDLDIAQVADLVRNSVKGFEATRYNLKDRRIPILVRFRADDRAAVEDVENLIVNPEAAANVGVATAGFGVFGDSSAASSPASRPIPLSSVADVALGEGPSEVRRIDGRRVALVRANLGDDGSLGGAVERIQRDLREMDWPSAMAFFITGQNQEWERSQASLWLALALSIFLVYVIMAAQFESLLHPFVIMFTIPLAFFGTFLALLALKINLSIVVFLGMIMLAGIVVNNAIVLVDYINTLQRRGMDRDEAILTAGTVRLRPILMTTATTALGLLPMALGLGDGAEIRTPMAISVISGLIVSTVLTLLIVPTIYAIVDRMQARLLGSGRDRGGATMPSPASEAV